MMSKLNPWQALVALAIIVAMIVVLILTGHESSVTLALKAIAFAVAGTGLAALNVARQQPPSGGAS